MSPPPRCCRCRPGPPHPRSRPGWRQRGELGVCALDSGSGRLIGCRADQRFAMCSTFKALLAGFVLARVEAGPLAVDQALPISRADLVPYAPAVKARLAGRSR
ncbi:serine hydrolase [Roseateles sp. DAIF2]|uniref:serine hydrolase n=1 Tax=Roseateles sp. DAIF2 TaxID=2714952 RepID=UPI0018A2D3DC|nr:serine hydrolase [Roseateles sp. DAIF2]QPF74544.1 serine hydrolase [Roseateles sp. DAIF2]